MKWIKCPKCRNTAERKGGCLFIDSRGWICFVDSTLCKCLALWVVILQVSCIMELICSCLRNHLMGFYYWFGAKT
ncbi:hypothetical protein QQP08_023161, partial [Theobroma cacao]